MEELTAEQALRVAARDGDEATVIRLLDAGTPVDAADMIGYTPLMLAARKGQTAMLRLLIARGANWRAKNRPKNMALDYAVQSGNIDAVRFLLELESDITGLRGRELLNMASSSQIGVIQLLRDSGAIDAVARLNSDEADAITDKLLLGETVRCKVCKKPLTYLWPGNSTSGPYGIYCSDGCTEIEERWRTPKE